MEINLPGDWNKIISTKVKVEEMSRVKIIDRSTVKLPSPKRMQCYIDRSAVKLPSPKRIQY